MRKLSLVVLALLSATLSANAFDQNAWMLQIYVSTRCPSPPAAFSYTVQQTELNIVSQAINRRFSNSISATPQNAAIVRDDIRANNCR